MASSAIAHILLICVFIVLFSGCLGTGQQPMETPAPTQTILQVSQTTIYPTETSTISQCPPKKNETPWIRINHIGTQYEDDRFTISGTTNLEVGEEIAVDAVPNPSIVGPMAQTGYYYTPPTVKVITGSCGNNIWSIEIDTAAYHKKYGKYPVLAVASDNYDVYDSTMFILNAGSSLRNQNLSGSHF